MRIGTQGDHFGVSGDRTWKREHYCGRRNRIHEYRAVHDGTGAMGTPPGQSSFDRWYVSRRFLLSAFGIGHGRDRRKSGDDVQDFKGSTRRIFLEIRSEEHTSELQSQSNLVCRLLLAKKKRGV